MTTVRPQPTALDPGPPNECAGESVQIYVLDKFADDARRGRVIGTTADGSYRRSGADSQRVFSIDDGALRIIPLLQPGWGKASIAYGPFDQSAGMAFESFLLNGHNTAQVENLPDTLPQRLRQWLYGACAQRVRHRVKAIFTAGRVRRTLYQFRWWWHLRSGRKDLEALDENLAVGWFPEQAPTQPVGTGHGFIMHATGFNNGELWVNVAGRSIPVIHGVMNIPLYLAVVIRETGAAYYAASVYPTPDIPALPRMKLLAIDDTPVAASAHALVSQSTIGQIGFRLDSRVYENSVSCYPKLRAWYGLAAIADRLTGTGDLAGAPLETGGQWAIRSGQFRKTDAGTVATQSPAMATIAPDTSIALIHARVTCPNAADAAELVFAYTDNNNYHSIVIRPDRCTLKAVVAGESTTLAEGTNQLQSSTGTRAIQLMLGSGLVRCFVDGTLAVEHEPFEYSLDSCIGFRIENGKSGASISNFEAHPDNCQALSAPDIGSTLIEKGTHVAVSDKFDGATRLLSGKPTSTGNKTWRRLMGTRELEVTGSNSCRVLDKKEPSSPDRTMFTIDWDSPGYTDLSMDITPPGQGRGENACSRIGFVLWQDEDNHVTFNIWNSDGYGGASFSTFFNVNGFENLYDAIWTNVGSRIWYGKKVRLRLISDGIGFLVYLDDEPVTFRKFKDVYSDMDALRINKVGIVLNWEWGEDSGSVIERFVAKTRGSAAQ